jgi:hypothetical protein
MLSMVGTAVGGVIGWPDATTPGADPADLRDLFRDLGIAVGSGAADLVAAVRRFQDRAGLLVDGVAGPRTVHLLARYAGEARELRTLRPAAA